jgi:hypothetical protein
MRTENKYNRNRAFRIKYWKRMRNITHPYETYCIYDRYGYHGRSYEEQVQSHFEWIGIRARALENGVDAGFFHATSSFRRSRNKQYKAKERSAMQKIRNGNYDIEVPTFKRDADWDFF